MMMSASEEARLSELDRVVDGQALEGLATLSDDLFAVVDVLDNQPALRRTLTDPTLPTEEREHVARSLFTGKITPSATDVVVAASGMRWHGGRSLATALERQAVRAALASAQTAGQLDRVEEELFRFDRTVAGDNDLRDAVNDRGADLEGRRQLVGQLVDGKVSPVTQVLLRRAVAGRERNFATTVEEYLELAARQRQRAVATVRVARALEPDQTARLRAALTKQIGRDVSLHVIVDETVLGGVRVELGDEVIEGTVAGRLDDARRMFR